MKISWFSAVTIALFLSGCAGTQRADYEQPIQIPYDAHTPPLFFSGLKIDLPKGEGVGVLSHTNRLCGFPYQPVEQNILRGEASSAELRNVFENALEPLGYDVVSAPESFFFEEEADDELLRTEYKIGAKLVELDMVACAQDSAFGFFGFQRAGVKGELFATYEWSIFDNIRKSTVYKTYSRGYTKRRDIHAEGLSLMINDSFAMAAYNLAADPAFHNLMVRGNLPQALDGWSVKHHENRARIFDMDEEVYIAPQAVSKTLDLEQAKTNTVMVQGGAGHGSGFFISQNGHILTNAHVVGKAQRVRIVTSGKAEKLAAEVLRINKERDVALLRIESVPHHLKINPLPVQDQWPNIGSDVYVIGAPLSTRLQDTVTKGIISAHRKNFKLFGQSIDLLQADVAIQAGNSGGPLIDSRGNIVGLSVAGTGLTNESLNYFIPINDAFTSLNITK